MTSQPDPVSTLGRARRCARCAIVALLVHTSDYLARGPRPAQAEPTTPPDPPPLAA